jgi:hypothetical protein
MQGWGGVYGRVEGRDVFCGAECGGMGLCVCVASC